MKRKTFFFCLTSIIFACVYFVFNRTSELARTALEKGTDILNALNSVPLSLIKKPFHLSFNKTDLLISFVSFAMFLMLITQKKRHFRLGEEMGSARWAQKSEIKPFIDPVYSKNIILTKTEKLKIVDGKDFLHSRNKNVFVVGGSGSGKTRFFVKPNILQGFNSLVITDPKGTLPTETGAALIKMGYDVKIFNIKSANGMKSSMHYNPFAYIKTEADIITFCKALIQNTKGEGEKSGEDFWIKAEELYYYALVGFIFYALPEYQQNFGTLLKLINMSHAKEDDDEYKGVLDLLFEELEEKDPENFAVVQYKKYKLAAGKTAKSILVSCGARLAPFDIKELKELMSKDELDLDTLGEQKTALFLLISDNNMTFNFLAAMVYTQLFQCLLNKADDEHQGSLPVHVECLLDEFANIGRIPDFDKIIATIRSRNISACPILQSKAQLESIYDKKADTIIDNCDSFLFLGGKSPKTLEDVVKIIGKETINTMNDTKSRGSQKSDSTNVQQTGRDLFTLDELAAMPRNKCILHITGVRPFYSDKYELEKHPRYKLLKERIDVEKDIMNPFPQYEEDYIFDDTTEF